MQQIEVDGVDLIAEAQKIIAQTERSLDRAVVNSDRAATICWGYHRLKEILEHTTPQKIDWPGESPLELTPKQEAECEQALGKSEKYLESNHDND